MFKKSQETEWLKKAFNLYKTEEALVTIRGSSRVQHLMHVFS